MSVLLPPANTTGRALSVVSVNHGLLPVLLFGLLLLFLGYHVLLMAKLVMLCSCDQVLKEGGGNCCLSTLSLVMVAVVVVCLALLDFMMGVQMLRFYLVLHSTPTPGVTITLLKC